MSSRFRTTLLVSCVSLAATHCAGSDQVPSNGTGGAAGTGGYPASGGFPATGGLAPSTGGLPGTGGVPGSGGVLATGGVPGTGGIGGAGGVAQTGGMPATGGVDGGSAGAGGVDSGTSGTGGDDGGMSGAGGVDSGASGTGGVIETGGTSGTGGTIETGGTSGSGGAIGTGGGGASEDASADSGGDSAADAASTSDAGAPDTSVDGSVDSSAPDASIPIDASSDSGLPNTMPGYENLAPPLEDPLDPDGDTALDPAPPAGWKWYPIEGTTCRDGSQAGMFVHFTSSDKLYIYLEGGGACSNLGFCNFNPANVNKAISGTGETVIGSALGVVDARQQPGVFEGGVLNGIFNTENAANPFQDWNGVYIPYCTGDVHFGTKANGTVPGVAAPQQFVGYFNMRKFIGHIVPTFQDVVDRVVITGASAGSFGAALNYSMVQDAFGDVRVDALLDSGLPFTDTYMPVCMQQRWRAAWGLNTALPPDCDECFNSDGGGLLNLADFLIAKHPNAHLAAVSSMNDEVIRLFFSMGLAACGNYDGADPYAITLLQGFPDVYYPAADYAAGMTEIRSLYQGTGRFATYFIGGPGLNNTYHQHVWRARFYDAAVGTETIAQFTQNFLDGQMDTIGP